MRREELIASMDEARTVLNDETVSKLFEWLDNATVIIDEYMAVSAQAGHGSINVEIDPFFRDGEYNYDSESNAVELGYVGRFDDSTVDYMFMGALADLIGELYENEYEIPVRKKQRSWRNILLGRPQETYRYDWRDDKLLNGRDEYSVVYVSIKWE